MNTIGSFNAPERFFVINSPDNRVAATYRLTGEEIAKSPFLAELVKTNPVDSEYVHLPLPASNSMFGDKIARMGLKYLQTGVYKDNPSAHINQFLAASYLQIEELRNAAEQKLNDKFVSLDDDKLCLLFEVALKCNNLQVQIHCFDAIAHSRTPEQIESLLMNPKNSETLDDLLDVAKRISKYKLPLAQTIIVNVAAKRLSLVWGIGNHQDEEFFGILRDLINRFKVEELELRGVQLTPVGAARFYKILKENLYVRHIKISNMEVVAWESKKRSVADSFGKIFEKNSVIETFVIDHSTGDQSALLTKLAERLAKNPASNIKVLGLIANKVGDAEGIALAEGLSKCPLLSTLDLSHNQLGVAAANALADKLKGLVNLRNLDLSHNQIGDEGFIKIAAAVEGFHLDSILFSNNNLGNDIGDSVWQLLKQNSSLRCLNLENNHLDTFGLKSLSNMLRRINFRNDFIIALNGNRITPEIQAHLEQTKKILSEKHQDLSISITTK